jgi:cell division protein FtsQ
VVGVLMIVLLAGGVIGGRLALLRSPWFRVTQIEVAAGGVSPALIRSAAAVPLGGPLLSVDLGAIGRAVSAVPPVASVIATRDWPHTVRITVTARTPVAVTPSADGPWLVDASGLAYQPAPVPVPALPRLTAARVSPADPATRAGLAVLASLTPPVRQKLRAVQAPGPNAVTLVLDGGKQVLWGSPDDSVRKAQVLQALLTQRGSYYDVSAPDLPTLRR